MIKYLYDAWGNHAVVDGDGNDVISGIGVLNPFRYRGYYYDTETELYYLQTRYYDPEIGRFISQDSIEDDILLWAGVVVGTVGVICCFIPGAQLAGGILTVLGFGLSLIQVVRRYT